MKEQRSLEDKREIIQSTIERMEADHKMEMERLNSILNRINEELYKLVKDDVNNPI